MTHVFVVTYCYSGSGVLTEIVGVCADFDYAVDFAECWIAANKVHGGFVRVGFATKDNEFNALWKRGNVGECVKVVMYDVRSLNGHRDEIRAVSP